MGPLAKYWGPGPPGPPGLTSLGLFVCFCYDNVDSFYSDIYSIWPNHIARSLYIHYLGVLSNWRVFDLVQQYYD